MYDDQYLYMFLRWPDDVASYKRQPFIKKEDGSWRKSAAKPLPADGEDWTTYMGKAFNEEAPGLSGPAATGLPEVGRITCCQPEGPGASGFGALSCAAIADWARHQPRFSDVTT